MAPTQASRRTVFQAIAQTTYYEWPAYDSTPLYDRSSLGGLEEDIRTVAAVWFDHDAHESVEEFVCRLPLAYVEFAPNDSYTLTTQYGMKQLFRAFLLKELHGWEHETAPITYLEQCPSLRRELGFDSILDQSTLWRSWHHRFTVELRETIETAAKTILAKADQAGVSVPREPQNTRPRHETDKESALDDWTVLIRAEEITDHVSQIVHPAFSLDRGEGCESPLDSSSKSLSTWCALIVHSSVSAHLPNVSCLTVRRCRAPSNRSQRAAPSSAGGAR